VPIIFTKVPETVIGSGEEILYPAGVSAALDYEAELGVVIGKGGRHIPRSSAADCVLGLYDHQRCDRSRLAGAP
jgi:2-keto-4-pentenoate hydratase/2-oxohepta-3-ene-1,7-dioic acid hydratase in catechol pathway